MGIELVIIAVVLGIIIVIAASAKKIKSDKQSHHRKHIPDEPGRNENMY